MIIGTKVTVANIEIRWQDGVRANREVHVYDCITDADVRDAVDALYPVGSTHTSPGVGRFTVIAHLSHRELYAVHVEYDGCINEGPRIVADHASCIRYMQRTRCPKDCEWALVSQQTGRCVSFVY